uniref:Uncharacterized protein n=1 Tax=Histophilus somni (strain 129Pt) TaxID=205914 RepID=Q0I360_HISS1
MVYKNQQQISCMTNCWACRAACWALRFFKRLILNARLCAVRYSVTLLFFKKVFLLIVVPVVFVLK